MRIDSPAAVKLRALIGEQIDDDALWLIYPGIGEAYLQQELRRLHAFVENMLDCMCQEGYVCGLCSEVENDFD